MNTLYPLRSVNSQFICFEEHGLSRYVCRQCGREFDDLTVCEAESLTAEGCPGDDCPSHWESQGFPHPEHTRVAYKYRDADYEAEFVKFWSDLNKNGGIPSCDTLGMALEQDEFFAAHIPTWNAIHDRLTGDSEIKREQAKLERAQALYAMARI